MCRVQTWGMLISFSRLPMITIRVQILLVFRLLQIMRFRETNQDLMLLELVEEDRKTFLYHHLLWEVSKFQIVLTSTKVSKSLQFKSKIKISNHYVKRNRLSNRIQRMMNLRRLKLTTTIAKREAAAEANLLRPLVVKFLTAGGRRRTQMLNQLSSKRWKKFTNKTLSESTLKRPT